MSAPGPESRSLALGGSLTPPAEACGSPEAAFAGASPSVRNPQPAGRNTLTRWAWNAAGLLACVVGFIGIVIPGLPSTVFFILAAGCFSRGSDRLREWVLALPKIGPVVRDYHDGLGMRRSAKYWAIGVMAVFVTLGAFALPRWWQVILAVSTAALGAAWIWFFIPTRIERR